MAFIACTTSTGMRSVMEVISRSFFSRARVRSLSIAVLFMRLCAARASSLREASVSTKNGSWNTLAASSKRTPCLRRLASAFSRFHTNRSPFNSYRTSMRVR